MAATISCPRWVLVNKKVSSIIHELDHNKKRPLTVGRGSCDVIIQHHNISRKHVILTFCEEDNHWKLTDVSSNGVLVNNVRIKSWKLRDGDVIEFGSGRGTEFGCERVSTLNWDELQYVVEMKKSRKRADSNAGSEGVPLKRSRSELSSGDLPQHESTSANQTQRAGSTQQTAVRVGEYYPYTQESDIESFNTAQSKNALEEVIVIDSDNESVKREGEASPRGKTANTTAEDDSAAPPAEVQKLSSEIADQVTCAICFEIMVGAHSLPCSHSFCGQCIFSWKKNHNTCPQCRETFRNDPTPVRVVDAMVLSFLKAGTLGADAKAEYDERLAAWQAQTKPSTSQANGPSTSNGAVLVEAEPDRLAYLGLLLDPEDDNDNDSDEELAQTFEVEYARSGRAQCRTCGERIGLNAIRWKVTTNPSWSHYPVVKYHHLYCITTQMGQIPDHMDLNPADREYVLEHLGC